MRQDMKKVVTERPRSGLRYKTPKGEKRQQQRCHEDDQPRREKIRVKWTHSYGGKEFTDLLGPLYRYLLKQVGRPWDRVYSEIAQNLPKTSMQNLHVYTHVWQFVEKDVKIVNGQACYNDSRSNGIPIRSYGRHVQLFIHPVTGLLCKAKRGKSRWEYRYAGVSDPHEPGIKVYPGCQYHKVKGVWYEVMVCKFPIRRDANGFQIDGAIADEVLGRHYSSRAELKQVYGGDYIAVSKRQLKQKEIHFAGLD